MVQNYFPIGQLVRLSAAFADDNGSAIDPTTITCKIKRPSGLVTTLTYAASGVTKDSVGNYHVDVVVDTVGIWHYRFEGTGTVTTADETIFYGEATAF